MEQNSGISSIEETLKKYIQNGYSIIGYGNDIYGNTFYAAEMGGSIYLVNQVNSPFNSVARLHYRFNIENKYEKTIELQDIQIELNDTNKGYGSILLKSLINLAKKLDVEYIYGSFSLVDEDTEEHIKRRRYFYEKFGFEIKDRSIKLYRKDFDQKS